MKLEDYRVLKGWPLEELAEKLGCHVETCRRYIKGTRVPGPEMYRKIREVTGGAVPYDTFIDG